MLQSFVASMNILMDNVTNDVVILCKCKSSDIVCQRLDPSIGDFFFILVNNERSCLISLRQLFHGRVKSLGHDPNTIVSE